MTLFLSGIALCSRMHCTSILGAYSYGSEPVEMTSSLAINDTISSLKRSSEIPPPAKVCPRSGTLLSSCICRQIHLYRSTILGSIKATQSYLSAVLIGSTVKYRCSKSWTSGKNDERSYRRNTSAMKDWLGPPLISNCVTKSLLTAAENSCSSACNSSDLQS